MLKNVGCAGNQKMPYAKRADKQAYDARRYRALRQKLIDALGGQCQYVDESGVQCTETENLEFHHLKPYGKQSRPNSKAYFRPEGKELRCGPHHKHTDSWRKRGRKKKTQ